MSRFDCALIIVIVPALAIFCPLLGGSQGGGGIPLQSALQLPPPPTSAGSGGDGTGGVPLHTDGTVLGGQPTRLFATTIGVVLDAQQNGLAGELVVVLTSDGLPIATATTDSSGVFAVTLPLHAGLELDLPGIPLVGVPIQAGAPIVVLVP